MSKIVHMADIVNNNQLITPEATLLDALSDIQEGKRTPNKLAVFMLDETDGKYCTNFYASNMKTTELIALCQRYTYVFNTFMD